MMRSSCHCATSATKTGNRTKRQPQRHNASHSASYDGAQVTMCAWFDWFDWSMAETAKA